ncbi:MAG: RecX family transcriptional regulator [Proteiniphilum sp.]|nr:RecX family transcriptional regulator [Proteiniphilum sp.]
MDKPGKMISEDQAFSRMARICSQKEYCSYDMRRKLKRMNFPDQTVEKIIGRLKKEKFIDEDRFARSFIHDKLRFNKWGKRKIEISLRQKQLPADLIADAFSQFSDASLSESLLPLLEKKRRTIKGRSEYEKNGKLIKYGLGRGFSIKEILACMKIMDLDELPDET